MGDHFAGPCIIPYSPEEALFLIVDLELTTEDYKTMWLGAKQRRADIYPSYGNQVIALTMILIQAMMTRMTKLVN